MRKIWVGFVVFCSLASAQLPAPEVAFPAFQADVARQVQLVKAMERDFPLAVVPLLNDLNTDPRPQNFRAEFDSLLSKKVTPLGGNRTRVDYFFSKAPLNLADAALALKNTYQVTKNGPLVEHAFFDVHYGYVCSLAATYLLIEGVKRQYVPRPNGPIALRIDQLHRATQKLVTWLTALRSEPGYAFLISARYFPPGESFEAHYTNNYFVGSSLEDVLADAYDLNAYLSPVAEIRAFIAQLQSEPTQPVTPPGPTQPPVTPPGPTQPPVTPPGPTQPPVTPPVTPTPTPGPTQPPVTPTPTPTPTPTVSNPTNLVEWQQAWDDVQRKLAQNPDDPALRQRLWELEQLKKTLPPGPAPTPAPTQGPAAPPAPTSGPIPPASLN